MQDLLRTFPVVIDIPIVWGDMDAFQHVNNVVYFRFFESVRVAYFGQAGFIKLMEESGLGPILASTSCKFRAPLTYPDTVSVGAKISNIEEDRFTMEYRVVSHRLGKVAAEGEGLIVSYNYQENKKAPLPAELKERFMELESSVNKAQESTLGPESIVTLREITGETVHAVVGLQVREEQKGFVASNAVSIAQAHFSDKAWFRAIYADETPVGFLMLYDNPDEPTYFLWRFMIDARYQGQGFGRCALELLIDYVKTRPHATELFLSHGQGLHSPEGFYRRLGFEHTGKMHGDELEMRLGL